MIRHTIIAGLATTALALAAHPAVALPPPPSAPFTLWNFLGIPQALHKIRDASINKAGNHPGLERLPPLKAIADPENMTSANPAIKAAAEIKTEEDLAPQKIKALKYLSRIGCDGDCYPQVKEALMAALEDCTEEVRYQAVLAIQDAITQHCYQCGKGCCCSEDMVLKLSERAYERDDSGCFIEPSERVREAAKAVICTCCPYSPFMPQMPEEVVPEGVPTPMPPTVPESAPETTSIWREGVLTRLMPSVAAWPETPRVARNRLPSVMPNAGAIASKRQKSRQVAATPPARPTPPVLRPDTPPIPTATFASTKTTVTTERPAQREAKRVATAKSAPASSRPAAQTASPKPATQTASAKPVARATATKPAGQSSRRNAVERGLARQPDSAPQETSRSVLRRPSDD